MGHNYRIFHVVSSERDLVAIWRQDGEEVGRTGPFRLFWNGEGQGPIQAFQELDAQQKVEVNFSSEPAKGDCLRS